MARTITHKTKQKAKERPKDVQPPGTKERRELVALVVGRYSPIAPLMSSTCKLWSLIVIGGLEQAFPINAIFLSIAEAKVCWKAIFNMSSEKLNAKKQR